MSAPSPRREMGGRASRSPSPAYALAWLFLTLFLRGRAPGAARGTDVARGVRWRLGLVLAAYALIGCVAFPLRTRTLFELSLALHALTFALVGTLVAAASSGILYDPREAEILLHRPVPARALLWAKLWVLTAIAWALSLALNLGSFVVGASLPNGGWAFVLAHGFSSALEGLFCASSLLFVHGLCRRWLGRERAEGLLTAVQVALVFAILAAAQGVSLELQEVEAGSGLHSSSWWLRLLPPVWFASIDVAIGTPNSPTAWPLASLAVVATVALVAALTTTLARDYARGLSTSNGRRSSPRGAGRLGRWLDALSEHPLLCRWLGDAVTREAFSLTARYLARDRGVRLRLYPGLAPLLTPPLALLWPALVSSAKVERFEVELGCVLLGGCLSALPVLSLKLLAQSEQWLAADAFRAAPLPGPGPLCDGARRAVLLFLSLPSFVAFALLLVASPIPSSNVLLLLPNAMAVPVYSLLACTPGRGGPLCLASTGWRSALAQASRVLGLLLTAFAVSAIALASRVGGWFWWLVLLEACVVYGLYGRLWRSVMATAWSDCSPRPA